MQYQRTDSHYTFFADDIRFRMLARPGVQRAGEANNALIQAARRIRGQRVFITGPGCTASALWAASHGAKVCTWTEHATQANVILRSFSMNNLECEIVVDTNFEGLNATTVDQALLHLPRGKALQQEQLQLTSALVKPGGQIAFVGAKNEGLKGALSIARDMFGEAGIIVKKKGYHAGITYANTPQPFPVPSPSTTHIEVDGKPTTLISYPGVFAPGRLDVGAAALIKGMEIQTGDLVLDLGCGTGLAGLTALRRGAKVILTDVSARAVASTEATLNANGYHEVPIHHVYGAHPFVAGTFDRVITNPPFHTGHDRDYSLPRLFVSEASRVLKAGGVAFFVTNNFLKYRPWLEAVFQEVSISYEDSRFRVWRAIK